MPTGAARLIQSSSPALSAHDFYFQQGETYYQNNRFRHAIQAFTLAITLDPLDYQAYNKRAVAKVGIKDYAGAYNDYSQAIAIAPRFYNAFTNRGNLWVYLGDLAKNLRDFTQAQQHYQRGLNDYTEAIRLNPLNSAAYENRGELYANLGLNSAALQDKAMAIRLQKLKAPSPVAWNSCPPRIALVLANDNYDGTENDLGGGPLKDANGMIARLRSQGFLVLTGFNLTGPQMKGRVSEFIMRLQENPGAVSLVYYSGHGGSIQGNNYLIPTNYQGMVDPVFQAESVSIDYLLQQLKYVNSRFNMIFLDACRTPLSKGTAFQAGKSAIKQWETEPGPGLSNTWIEYASRPRMPAIQDSNEGLYTKYLLQYMARPDLNLKEVSMYTSFALESDPVALRENQHASTQTDLSRTEPFAQAFSFASHCPNPNPHARTRNTALPS